MKTRSHEHAIRLMLDGLYIKTDNKKELCIIHYDYTESEFKEQYLYGTEQCWLNEWQLEDCEVLTYEQYTTAFNN